MYIHLCVSTGKVLSMLQKLQTQGPQFARSINDRLAHHLTTEVVGAGAFDGPKIHAKTS